MTLRLQGDISPSAYNLRLLLQSDRLRCSRYSYRGMLEYLVVMIYCNPVLPYVSGRLLAYKSLYYIYTAQEAQYNTSHALYTIYPFHNLKCT
uniref:Uncharacterized protein n=1 Tax=Arundo donax TaxID=35708 RepID=A0A0A9ACW4_ARUDO